MASVTLPNSVKRDPPEPAWDVATLFPAQGHWTEKEYLELPGNHFVELSDGAVEVLAMPTEAHQSIVAFLHSLLLAFVSPRGSGKALLAPFPIRLWPGKIREPDVMFMLSAHAGRRGKQSWAGADLVMEVVSEDRSRDLDVKREEYARAGIAEYWIVDPENQRITVLKLNDSRYVVHGEFSSGALAESHLLSGFKVDVAAVFAAAAD